MKKHQTLTTLTLLYKSNYFLFWQPEWDQEMHLADQHSKTACVKVFVYQTHAHCNLHVRDKLNCHLASPGISNFTGRPFLVLYPVIMGNERIPENSYIKMSCVIWTQ